MALIFPRFKPSRIVSLILAILFLSQAHDTHPQQHPTEDILWNSEQVDDHERSNSNSDHGIEMEIPPVPSSAVIRSLTEKSTSHGTAPVNGPNIRALVVLLVFQGHEERLMPSKSHFEKLCDNGLGADGVDASGYFNPQFGSAAHYLFQQSTGRYKVTCTVTDWFPVNKTEAFVANGNSNLGDDPGKAQQMVWSAMSQVESQLTQQRIAERRGTGDGLDWWTVFDTNGDNAFDAFIIIHSGYNAQAAGACDNTTPEHRIASQGRSETLPQHAWKSTHYDPDIGTGIYISNYAIMSAFGNQPPTCSNDALALAKNAAPLQVLVREWIMMLTQTLVPALYDKAIVENNTNTDMVLTGGLGNFDLLASQGRVMGSLSAYTKMLLGWIEVDVIDRDGLYDLQDINVGGKALRIDKKFDTSKPEYLLIENRQVKGYDANLVPTVPGPRRNVGGFLIYHVDESILNNAHHHYRVALMAKDGRNDIQQGVNNGDDTDFWSYGDTLVDVLSYYKGRTGISTRVFSTVQDDMTLAVSGISFPPIPLPQPQGTPPPVPVPTAVLGDTTEAPLFVPTAQRPPSTRTPPPAPVPTAMLTTAPPTDLIPTATTFPTIPVISKSDSSRRNQASRLSLLLVPVFVVAMAGVIWYMRRLWRRIKALNSYDPTATAELHQQPYRDNAEDDDDDDGINDNNHGARTGGAIYHDDELVPQHQAKII